MGRSKKDDDIVIFNCKMSLKLKEDFKIKTIKDKTTMSDVVIEAIKEYVAE